MVSPWAGHGSLSFKPRRNIRRILWSTNLDFDSICQWFCSLPSMALKGVLFYPLLHFLLCFGKELLLCFFSHLVKGLSSSGCPMQDLWFPLARPDSSLLFPIHGCSLWLLTFMTYFCITRHFLNLAFFCSDDRGSSEMLAPSYQLHGIISKKTTILFYTVMKISNLPEI
jgi:hypothetical protein